MARPLRLGVVETRRGVKWVETRVTGHVMPKDIAQMAAGFAANGGGATWLVDASDADSYDAGAIRGAIDAFTALAREHGLRQLVALISKPAVRMGASVVAMSLRAVGASVQVVVVGERAALEQAGR